MLGVQAKFLALLVTPGARPHLRHQDAQHHHQGRRGEGSHHDHCSSVYSTDWSDKLLAQRNICDGQEEWMDRVLVDFLPGEKKTSFSKAAAHYVSSGQSALGQSSCLERSSLTLVVTFLLEYLN